MPRTRRRKCHDCGQRPGRMGMGELKRVVSSPTDWWPFLPRFGDHFGFISLFGGGSRGRPYGRKCRLKRGDK